MEITSIGWGLIPVLIILFFKLNNKQLMGLSFILSIFTMTSLINIKFISFSVTVNYVIVVLFIIKTFYYILFHKYKTKIPINKCLIFFLIYCLFSLTFPLYFTKGTIVLNFNDEWSFLAPNLQMITQTMYIFLAIIYYFCVLKTLFNEEISLNYLYKLILLTILVNTIICILQLILPLDIFNDIFRNGSQIQTINGQGRLSGATFEASNLALITVPMIGYLIALINNKFNIILLMILGVNLFLLFLSQSSSFFIGIVTVFAIMLLFNLMDLFGNKKIGIGRIIIGILCSILLLSSFNFIFNIFSEAWDTLFNKLNSVSISGMQRGKSFSHHMGVFYDNFLLGVGYGTIKGYDLVSSLLAQLGLIGSIPIILFFVSLFKKVIYIKDFEVKPLITLLLSHFIILFISVPLYHYPYMWLFYAYITYRFYVRKD